MTTPPKKSKPSLVNCSICGVKVRKDRLNRHINRVHKKLKTSKRGRNKISSTKKLKAPINQRYLIDEFGIVHFYSSWYNENVSNENRIVVSQNAQKRKKHKTKTFIRCPECGVQLRNKNLSKHLRKVHINNP